MRQLSTIVLLIFTVLALNTMPSYSAIKGKINYSIPIDLSKLSETELKDKADDYYFLAKQAKEIDENVTNALFLYSVLSDKNPENIRYCMRLGILYDKFGIDRHAKGNFSKAISINSSLPDPYFYLGEFYYKRESYRKALKYYNEAFKKGFNNYDILYRIGDIYEKFGDTRSALKYLNDANSKNPNPELSNKIKRIEAQDASNKEYYSNTRIRIR